MIEPEDSYELEIIMADEVPSNLHDPLSATIYQALEQHLERDALVKAAELQVTLLQFREDGRKACVKLSIDGTINSQPISGTYAHKRNLQNATLSAGVPGSFIGSLVLQSLVSVIDHAAFAETPKQMECLDECLGDMMLLIDRTLGRNETPVARRWRIVRLTRWLVAAAVLIASMITTRVMNEDIAPWSGVVTIASIQAFCAFGVVHLFGLAIMPDRFFLLEPRGKKALARTGVRNINTMRLLVIFVGLLAITLFLCAGLPVIGFI